jgi:nitrogenase molybdenum-iron protein beta chain
MLDATPRDCVTQRKALVSNPAKTCQPVGAIYAALGVHKTMPHSHGSQGCVAFHRMFLTRHFKEPAMASTSAFTEGASVFGGGANLKTAVRNIFDIYDPDCIAVHTTCLSETIGDDLHAFISAIDIPEGKKVVYCSTPSYQGSHVTGFSSMAAGFVKHLARSSGVPNGKTMVVPGFVNPGDMRETKRYLESFGVDYVMLPDTTGVMDAPMTGTYELYPAGGTTLDEIESLGDCTNSIALGAWASEACALQLLNDHGVPADCLPLPIGLDATDEFVMFLAKQTGEPVPEVFETERGQLLDALIDVHQYLDGKRVAIAGDPDTVIGLTAFALECGMFPAQVITGTPGSAFEEIVRLKVEAAGLDPDSCFIKAGTDYLEVHQRIIQEPVDLLLGPSLFKQIAKAEDIPLVRAGFPVLDRYVHPLMPIVGYRGALRLLENMANALMDQQDRTCADEDLEFVM